MQVTTKYNLGQVVWIMYKNKIREVEIRKIDISMWLSHIRDKVNPSNEEQEMSHVRYEARFLNYQKGDENASLTKLEGGLYSTKEELIKSLI